jgi:hypothetical protein
MNERKTAITWTRQVDEQITIFPHEEADLSKPFGQTMYQPIEVNVAKLQGSCILNVDGKTEVVYVDMIPGKRRPEMFLQSKDGKVKANFNRLKVELSVSVPKDYIALRSERLDVPFEVATNDYPDLAEFTGIALLIELKQRLADIEQIKHDINCQRHHLDKDCDHAHYLNRLERQVESQRIEYQAIYDLERLNLLNESDLAVKFMDAALSSLDASLINDIYAQI